MRARRRARASPCPQGTELVVTSPGLAPATTRCSPRAARPGIPVWGEVELAWRLRPRAGAAPWLAVTGTNGKTTTVEHARVDPAGRRACARSPPATSGTPLLEAVLRPASRTTSSPSSCPASSCTGSARWRPVASAVPQRRARPRRLARLARGLPAGQGPGLPEHRGRLRLQRRRPGDRAAGERRRRRRGLPGGRLHPRRPGAVACSASSTTCWSTAPSSSSGARRAAELATLADLQGDARRRPAQRRQRPGRRGPGPRLRRAAGGRPRRAARLRARPAPHRRRRRRRRGRYVDDSKATNPHAAAASLLAFEHVVWIAGGLPRAPSFDELVSAAAERLRGVVLIGADRALIAEALARHAPEVPVVDVPDTDTGAMDRRRAREAARLARRPVTSCCSRRRRLDGHVRQLRRRAATRSREAVQRHASRPRRAARRHREHRQHAHARPRPPPAAPAAARGSCRRSLQRLDSPVTTYYLLLGATVDARRHRPGHGAVRLERHVAARRPTPPTPSSCEPAAVRRRSAVIGAVVAAGAGARLEAARPAGAPRRVAAAAGAGLHLAGRHGQRQPQLDRAWGRSRSSPPSSPSSASCWSAPRSWPSKRQLLGEYMHAVVPLPLPGRRARCSAARARRPRPRHRAGPHRHRRGMLFAAGVPTRVFAFAGAAAAVLAAVHGPHQRQPDGPHLDWLGRRLRRPQRHLLPACHGLYALADGGWWGVGLGRQPGEVAVAARGAQRLHLRDHRRGARAARDAGGPRPVRGCSRWACYRLVSRTDDLLRPHRHAPASWPGSSVQAHHQHRRGHRRCCRSIGVPLPLVSAGGSALVTTLFALGMLLSFARNEPGCAEALSDPSRRRSSPLARGPAGVAADGRRRMSTGLVLGPARRRRLRRARVTAARPGRLPAPQRPRRADHRARHRDRARGSGWCPARGYPLRTIPKVALPAAPLDRPGPAAGLHARCGPSRPARPSTRPAPRSSSASAATSRPRPTSPPGAAGCRSSCTSRTPVRAWPTGSAPG